MRRMFPVLLIFLLIASADAIDLKEVPVHRLSVVYDVQADGSVHETWDITFSKSINSTANITLPAQHTRLKVHSNNRTINHTVSGTNALLNITLPTTHLSIEYTVLDKILDVEEVALFLSEVAYAPISKFHAEVVLPEGYVIQNKEYIPQDALVSSDGRRIHLEWNRNTVAQPLTLSSKFVSLEEEDNPPTLFSLRPVRSLDIRYTILNGEVTETTTIRYLSSFNESFSFLTKDVNDLTINNFSYRIRDEEGSQKVFVNVTRPTQELVIQRTLTDRVFQRGPVYVFLAEPQKSEVKNTTVSARVPDGFTLQEYSPEKATVTNLENGTLVTWDENAQAFSVRYVRTTQQQSLRWITLLLLILIVMLTIYYKKRTKEEFLKGFREDEKKVITYLQDEREIFQSRIQKEFGFSRAKVTRIVKKLEEKGFLRKESHGRTNKLYWTK